MTPEEFRTAMQAWLDWSRELLTYKLNDFFDSKVEAGLLDFEVAEECKADCQLRFDDVQKRCDQLVEGAIAECSQGNAADD